MADIQLYVTRPLLPKESDQFLKPILRTYSTRGMIVYCRYETRVETLFLMSTCLLLKRTDVHDHSFTWCIRWLT